MEKTLKARRAQLEEAMEDYRELVEFEVSANDGFDAETVISCFIGSVAR